MYVAEGPVYGDCTDLETLKHFGKNLPFFERIFRCHISLQMNTYESMIRIINTVFKKNDINKYINKVIGLILIHDDCYISSQSNSHA